MKKGEGKKSSSAKNITLKLNKTNMIVIGVCVLIVVGVLIIAFGGEKSLTHEELESGSQEGTTEEQKGLFDFFLKLFNKTDIGDFELPEDVGDGTSTEDDETDLFSGTDTNDSSGADNQSADQVCGNTCAQNYNQKPYPDCSCYIQDTDTDNDGVDDSSDAFPNDPSETQDTDSDGVGNNADDFPNDPNETIDTDGDGVGDNADDFPNDPERWQLPDCDDSDGGKDVHVKGTIEGLDDCCTDELGNVCLFDGTSDYIMEHYCNETNDPLYEVIQCSEGEKCVAKLGKCVPEIEFSCDTSDWDEFMGELDDSATEATCTDLTGIYTDQCEGDGRYIYEYNCIDNFCVQDRVECNGPDECLSSSATHCTRISVSEVVTNPNSKCYGRTNYLGVSYGCWGRGFDQATCENSYQDGGSGIWYGCKWGGSACDGLVICAID
jgi:hypothetical protein